MRIKINGPIILNDDQWIYDLFGMDATSPKKALGLLPESGDVTIQINSYGGYVDAGNEIYTSLKNHPGKVTVEVVMAGSAASVIAMAGDEIKMSPVGQIMIHNASMYADGDYHEMDKASEVLRKTNDSLANAYCLKTGLSKEDILSLMEEETWLTADEAIDFGFADSILFAEEEKEESLLLVANAMKQQLLPKEVIEKVRNERKAPAKRSGFLF